MAYHPRGGGRRFPPRNDFDRHVFQICHDLGISFPPNPAEAWPRMMFHKDRGQEFLNNGLLRYALDHYSMALGAAELFPQQPQYQEEHAKILCNRSLVFFKMRRFQDAENDATTALAVRPGFIKGYWRAYQSVRGGHNGSQIALPYVCEGLRKAMHGHGTVQDEITFLTELCTLIPHISNNPMTEQVLHKIEVPDLITDKDIWTKAIQNLTGNSKWESLRILVLGNSGPECELRGICSDFEFSSMDISGLLELSLIDLTIWGTLLAVKMIELGASPDKIGEKFKKPTLHVIVENALKTGRLRLLECILAHYNNNAEVKNAQNSDGQTALHLAVLSGKAYQLIGEQIVNVLLRYQCDVSLRDQHGKRPIDYVMQGTNVFLALRKAAKSDLRKELETVKQNGNEALKRGDNTMALRLYGEALEISKQSEELYKEAAVVYSNTAKVYFSMKSLQNALTNAFAAVSCDVTYHKGHWWKGKILCQMGAVKDGFSAYLEGYTHSVNSDIKTSFVVEAVTQLQHLIPADLISSYKQLYSIDEEVWPLVLQKLSSNTEWKCIAYLIVGPKLDIKQFKAGVTEEAKRKLHSGVAGKCSTDSMDLRTIFFYLQRSESYSEDLVLLDVLLVAVYLRGPRTALQTLCMNVQDTPLHALTRFALLTGRTVSLVEVLRQPLAALNDQFIDGTGNSVYHAITRMTPFPEERNLVRVTELFLDKGFSPMTKDMYGRLAVEYLDKSYSGHVFDIFFKRVVHGDESLIVAAFSMTDVNDLKERGNNKFKSGDILEAIELYTQAIDMIESQSEGSQRGIASKDIAVLYGNRAESYLKMSEFNQALEDAKCSVSYRGHWHKAHLRVGKALRGLKKHDVSLKAFINAYRDVEPNTDDGVRIEILTEMTLVCKQMPKDKFNSKTKLTDFPEGQGHVWIKTSYELIKKDEWGRASIAYNQFTLSRGKTIHITYTLKPICRMDRMKEHPWVVDLIHYFLEYGADKKTLTFSVGDTYIHAAVRICLLVAKNGKLVDWLLKKYKETNLLDKDGNTVLHTATKERGMIMDIRYNIIMVLLQANVNPKVKNSTGQLAIDYLPGNETKSKEILRMAMFRDTPNVPKAVPNASSQPEEKTKIQETSVTQQAMSISKKFCEECQTLLNEGVDCFGKDLVLDGYTKLTEILKFKHESRKHEGLVQRTMIAIVDKLGEKSVPEIPQCVTSIAKKFYQQVVDGLIQKQKWRQLHAVIRKYRAVKGSEHFKGFANGLSIVPVIRDPVFIDSEELLIQIITNMLNSGAYMGTDSGQTALKQAKEQGHFKLVSDLIKGGADTSHFTLTPGDTPIHAIVTMVLEREKALTLLEFVFAQYEKDPESFKHLNPYQQNKAGDSLFHLVAKAKKVKNIVVMVTEFLCKKNLSAGYLNKERKLPGQYITKKNDRRLQYIRLAATIQPVGQKYFRQEETSESQDEDLSGDELNDFPRRDEVGSAGGIIVEKVKHESEREQRKIRIGELIRLLPDSNTCRAVDLFDDFVEDLPEVPNKTESAEVKHETGKLKSNGSLVDRDEKAAKMDKSETVEKKIMTVEKFIENQGIGEATGGNKSEKERKAKLANPPQNSSDEVERDPKVKENDSSNDTLLQKIKRKDTDNGAQKPGNAAVSDAISVEKPKGQSCSDDERISPDAIEEEKGKRYKGKANSDEGTDHFETAVTDLETMSEPGTYIQISGESSDHETGDSDDKFVDCREYVELSDEDKESVEVKYGQDNQTNGEHTDELGGSEIEEMEANEQNTENVTEQLEKDNKQQSQYFEDAVEVQIENNDKTVEEEKNNLPEVVKQQDKDNDQTMDEDHSDPVENNKQQGKDHCPTGAEKNIDLAKDKKQQKESHDMTLEENYGYLVEVTKEQNESNIQTVQEKKNNLPEVVKQQDAVNDQTMDEDHSDPVENNKQQGEEGTKNQNEPNIHSVEEDNSNFVKGHKEENEHDDQVRDIIVKDNIQEHIAMDNEQFEGDTGNLVKDDNIEESNETDDVVRETILKDNMQEHIATDNEQFQGDTDNLVKDDNIEESNETDDLVRETIVKDNIQEHIATDNEQFQGDTGYLIKDDNIKESNETDGQKLDIEIESDEDMEEEEEEEEEECDAKVFDDLEWEVECTADVWKTLQDKHVLPKLKNRIVKKLKLLASGDWQPVLCKKLRNVPKTLDLFEAKFSKGSRIIWEKAIAFSARCSESAERRLQMDSEETDQPVRGGRIYSEIIRVWAIVFDHDKIYRSIERIKKSHQRGEDCIIQKRLRGIKVDATQLSLSQGCRIYPKMFAENDVPVEKVIEQQEEMQHFFPPASSNEQEYHILKFYSFSSTLVSHVLQNLDTKVDFPFRVTDLEHAIINLSSRAPILLLGRSGTGKTTCCLYRLWSQFHGYWKKANDADAPLLPRITEFIHAEATRKGDQEEENEDSQEENSDEEQGASGAVAMSSSCDQSDQQTVAQYDHIHQLFITKNLVLCSEVQKNFRELSHADDLMKEQVQHEEDELANKLQDVGDYSYPLFLTSRQLLLMLDASIGQPYFFDRSEDGSLKADIAGWSEDGPLSVLPLLDEDSDNENEYWNQYEDVGEADETGDFLQATSRRNNKVDPRREITYTVFVEEVWPKIKKRLSYHPSLVWTEIMSFIKGSFEALSQPCGYLALEEYLKLGKKRAPNFSAEREPIHQFFKRYEHFKKQHHLFDETDLVHNIYGRLRQMDNRSWVIHQVFVDETQDFTQAELCLLIRICQNPNDMFLTGDTAQSIMRGISFRFSDLRSLFYHAKKSMQAMGKTSAVEVPKKVYQLTHNYRSHAGILSLASSVLELMVEFFPESFDRLQRDQGLFNGPQPILLESCSFSDLAVLLRGNKRRTSHIEFGAHQAILVVNEAARDAIPDELRLGLVLTIYEAKGLEFDDVLLYNFFKDSQAVKEWRVVTEYLERLLAVEQEERGQNRQESLVEIDQDILNQPDRPRPLNFDPNLHKVLNSELKHLYTALTRARVNVWIFDEDMGKRAPMFEYFRARRLVKSITVSEINEESLAETVFAEKSSKEDWIRRGEDFIRHSIYGVAAKCFAMAGDHENEKVALAHVQALEASRLKDNPREMRREFLKAAEMYLNCNRPAKAAICLQNSRERELAAELFEKLGQYERAGDIYRKLKRPIASSRCYEQLGNFNKAIVVLYENEDFDMAIDTLKRYEMRLQDYAQRNLEVPVHLLANRPADYYTEEKLSHKSAEKFYRLGNTEKMLNAIDFIPKVSDRVEFLESKGLIRDAAKVLEDNGELKKATDLLLMHGFHDRATELARVLQDEKTIGRCILVFCRVLMDKTKESSDFPVEIPAFQQKEVLQNMAEGIEMFEATKCNDEFGELRLLQADLSKNIDNVKQAWKAFKDPRPVPNEAGLVECAAWLMNHAQLDQIDILSCIIQSIGHMFTMCGVLCKPDDASNHDRVSKYLSFYGLRHVSQTELVLHPKERPLSLNILKGQCGKMEMAKYIVDKYDAYQAIITYILKRTQRWIDRIWEVIFAKRNKNQCCHYFQVGLECPGQDNSCVKLHQPLKKENMTNLIGADLLLIEFEGEIQEGASRMKKLCPTSIGKFVDVILAEGERDISAKYKACFSLLNDLIPFSGHHPLINEDSGQLIEYLQKSPNVLRHVRDFLKEQWKSKTSNHEKALKCQASKETDIFIMFDFVYHLFGIDVKYKDELSPFNSLKAFERDIDYEINKVDLKNKKLAYYSFVTFSSGQTTYVDCIAKRCLEAFSWISSNPNPYEAVFQFSKFVTLLKKRADATILPDLHHYTMWLEFYLTLAIILTAKMKTQMFKDFLFFLPSNYLALMRFIEATFPNPKLARILISIHNWHSSSKSFEKDLKRLEDRLKYISFGVCGFEHKINILQEALNRSLGDPHMYGVAERIIVLLMLLVLNVGKVIPVECEVSLMNSLSQLKIPEDGPDRLKRLAKDIQNDVKGIYDVAAALESLLKSRQKGEELLLCRWDPNSRQKLVTTRTSIQETKHLFSDKFWIVKAKDAMHDQVQTNGVLESERSLIEEELTQEEIDKRLTDKHKQDQEDRKNKAAVKITRFFKRIVEMRKARRYMADIEGKPLHGEYEWFETVKITDDFCAYCGEYFDIQNQKMMSYEQSDVVGDHSVMNIDQEGDAHFHEINTSISPVRDPSQVTFERSSSYEGRPDNRGDGEFVDSHGVTAPTSPELWSSGSTNRNIPWQSSRSRRVRIDPKEMLKKIKEKHSQDSGHIQRKREYEAFKKKCKMKILPKLETIREFLDNEDYRLNEKKFAEKKYEHRYTEIGRMKNLLPKIHTKIFDLFNKRQWSMSGEIEQLLTELGGYFEIVRQYVEEIYNKEKEDGDRARQIRPSTSATKHSASGISDEEDEETFEEVVPQPNKRQKTKIYSRRRDRWRGQRRY